MQDIKFFSAFLLGCLMTLVLGLWWSSYSKSHHPDPWIELHIENQTDQHIKRIQVESWLDEQWQRPSGVMEYFDIKQHRHLVLPITFYTNGSYKLEFELADGTVCQRKNPRVKPGSFVFEVLEKFDQSC